MNTSTILALGVATFLVAANAFFVAVEFAFVAARTARLEANADEDDRRSKQALSAVRDLQPQLAGAQLGITMASLALGFVAEPALAGLIESLVDLVVDVSDRVLHTIGFVAALAIVVPVHVVAGEMVAKNIAIAKPEWTARHLAGLMQLYIIAFRPVIWVLNMTSNGLVRLIGVKPVDEITTVLTTQEFHALLAGARDEGVIEPSEHDLLSGALEFRDRSVGSLMVPTSGMVAVHRSATVADIEQVVAGSGHTRIPIWGLEPDDILGFVHAKDLLRMPVEARDEPVPMELTRRMLVTAPDVPALQLMRRMCGLRVHMALVKGSETTGSVQTGNTPTGHYFAGEEQPSMTLGIITLEDVLEALVGEIYDETDENFD